jgi:hypothetical protein
MNYAQPITAPRTRQWGPPSEFGPLANRALKPNPLASRGLSAGPEARSIECPAEFAWIEELYRRVRANKTQAAMDLLLRELDQCFDRGAFGVVDGALGRIQLDRLNVTLVVGLLSFTKVARTELQARAALVERAEEWLRQHEPARVERILARVR